MPRSDRSLVAPAIFGLIVCGWGAGIYTASLWTNKPASYPYYQDRQAKPPSGNSESAARESIKAVPEKRPCGRAQSRDESNLCASWRAAEAAEEAASSAFWQLIASGVGVVGLLITLWFNWEAWRQARESESDTVRALQAAERTAAAAAEANDVARETSARSLRAYLGVLSLKCTSVTDNILIIKVTFKNYGNTPAHSAHVEAACWIEPNFRKLQGCPGQSEIKGFRPIINGQDQEPIYIFQDKPPWLVFENEKAMIFVEGNVTYFDVFEVKRFVKFYYRSNGRYQGVDTEFIPFVWGNDAN